MEKKLTLAAVRRQLAMVGVTIGHTDWDEYRVNLKGGKEKTAYYTTDLQDALDTGMDMSKVRQI